VYTLIAKTPSIHCIVEKMSVLLSDHVTVFEYSLNEKVVYSTRLLKEMPNFDELIEITYWMNEGKSFMHMYLCTFVEGGGETIMVLNDKKNTPLLKRVVMSCTIS